MADYWVVYFHLVAAFLINIIALQQKVSAQGSAEATQAIQVTVSSTQSVASLISVSPTQTATGNSSSQIDLPNLECPDGLPCRDLGVSCINCTMNYSCIYGKDLEAQCVAYSSIECTGNRTFKINYTCKYCYQLHPDHYECEKQSGCKVVSSPRERYKTNCTVKDNFLCLGNRTFPKSLLCNWTSGYRWSTAVLLSLTLGGFGVDRFYLGHWREGLGKLFSFGGLGVWTLVDLILIIIRYVGPEDGSLYIF